MLRLILPSWLEQLHFQVHFLQILLLLLLEEQLFLRKHSSPLHYLQLPTE